jgi:hypothetical protein
MVQGSLCHDKVMSNAGMSDVIKVPDSQLKVISLVSLTSLGVLGTADRTNHSIFIWGNA